MLTSFEKFYVRVVLVPEALLLHILPSEQCSFDGMPSLTNEVEFEELGVILFVVCVRVQVCVSICRQVHIFVYA